jgi:SPX domain protein involved in polyphosphate accumulation
LTTSVAQKHEAAQITLDRRELKYVLPAERAAGFIRSMAPLLALHRYRGAGANPLPRAQHYTTTVYFDTDAQDLCRAAVREPVHVKARAREYYDLHPDLTELATDPRDLLQYQPVLWIELKLRDGQRSRKRRVGVPKRQVERFFERFEVSPEMLALQPDGGTELREVIAEFDRLRVQFGKPLRASCIVNYRRLAWEDPDASLRVTLDRNLCAFAPPADLWTRREALTREALGQPAHEERDAVLEIKSRGALPAWLGTLLTEHRAREVEYSKFVMASSAIYGEIR